MTKRGFTLIELLVVISIISLLSSIILASLNSARIKARDITRVRFLREFQKAVELSAANNGNAYPSATPGTCIYCNANLFTGSQSLPPFSYFGTYFKYPGQIVAYNAPSGVGANGLWYISQDGGKNYKLVIVGIENISNTPASLLETASFSDSSCNNKAISVFSSTVAKDWLVDDQLGCL